MIQPKKRLITTLRMRVELLRDGPDLIEKQSLFIKFPMKTIFANILVHTDSRNIFST